MLKAFVTGAPRSGTTLMDKLLSLHIDVHIHSQPLPLLYVRLKREFLQSIGHTRYTFAYPLSDLFLDNYYDPALLIDFLRRWPIDADTCRDLLVQMVGYDGQYTRPSDPYFLLKGYRECRLLEFVSEYCAGLAGSNVPIVGTKETFCEEFIPYYLAEGLHVLQMMRDPRDRIASMTYGLAGAYSGAARPHLFNIRQWRKSAAFALAMREHDRFQCIRYEDLVTNPQQSLSTFCSPRGRSFPGPLLKGALVGQSGRPWMSNSSHQPTTRLSGESVGAHRRVLPDGVRRLIEACCFHEMRALGYSTELDRRDVVAVLMRYSEEAPLERPELVGYAWSRDRMDEEVHRLQMLNRQRYDAPLFLFEHAFESLLESAPR